MSVLPECRIPNLQVGHAGHFTTCYSASERGAKGCGFWIDSWLAKSKHIAVLHQDPSRLCLTVRSKVFSIDVLIMHGPVEGSAESEEWWATSLRIAKNMPCLKDSLFFVDANARLGSVLSEAVGDVHAEPESANGAHFHAWLLAVPFPPFAAMAQEAPGVLLRNICAASTTFVVQDASQVCLLIPG